MAVSTTSYFNNAIVGVPQVGADVDIYDQHSTPHFALGTKFERQDGAIFRYVHFGAAITSAGLLLAQDISESGMELTSECILTSSSTYQMPDDPIGVYPNCKGSKYAIITKASITADQFAGAYFAITSATANNVVGQTYRIRSNTAVDDPVSGSFRAELYHRLQTTLGSDSGAAIVGCKYANLEMAAWTGTDMVIAGVSILSSGTTDVYGWVQTKGICAVLNDAAGTPLTGRVASISSDLTDAIGTVGMSGANTATTAMAMPVVGVYCNGGSLSTYNFIDLKIE